MKRYFVGFLTRGLLFAWSGPAILAIVYLILGSKGIVHSLSPEKVALGILTSTLLAFIAAGCSVVYKIEALPLLHATMLHALALYLDYILIYLLNGWLMAQLGPILIFTVLYAVGYALIWLVIFSFTKARVRRINQKLQSGV